MIYMTVFVYRRRARIVFAYFWNHAGWWGVYGFSLALMVLALLRVVEL